jgi:hypothetical protein
MTRELATDYTLYNTLYTNWDVIFNFVYFLWNYNANFPFNKILNFKPLFFFYTSPLLWSASGKYPSFLWCLYGNPILYCRLKCKLLSTTCCIDMGKQQCILFSFVVEVKALHNIPTSMAVRTSWYHFTQGEHFCSSWMLDRQADTMKLIDIFCGLCKHA